MLRRARDKTLANHPTTCSPYSLLFLRIVSSATRVNATFRSFLHLVSPRKSQAPESDQAGQDATSLPGTPTVSPPVPAYQALIPFGGRGSRGHLCLSVVTAPFLFVARDHNQAKFTQYPSRGYVPSCRPFMSSRVWSSLRQFKRTVKRCMSLFKGRAVADAPRLPD